ncbi:hypothetical protein AAG906_028680 [Vitis piasezkii]
MDNLFKRANKYSMLEDDVRVATQQVLVTSRPAKNNLAMSSKTLSQQKQSMAEPIKMDPAKRDRIKKCVYHKEHGHTTEQCRSLHYLVERLIRVGHLRQYVCLEGKNWGASQEPATTTPTTSEAPRAMINYIHGGPIDEEYNSKRKRQRLFQVASVRERLAPFDLD